MRPSPLAAAALTASLAWLLGPFDYQGELAAVAAGWVALGAALSSLYRSPQPLPLVMGALSGLGPAGALIALSLAASMPVCYSCSGGERLQGRLVAVALRTSPLRGPSTLPDGKVVACARGEPIVAGDHVEVRSVAEAARAGALFAAELGDPLVKGFLASGGALAQPGCRGETLMYRPAPEEGGKRRV